MPRLQLPTVAFAALGVWWCWACDGGEPGLGQRGAACNADADCGSLVCVAALEPAPVDLDPLPLACGDPHAQGRPGQPCETADDCARGICLLAGACAVPCQRADDCGARERCDPVFARASEDALQRVTACVALVNLPESVRVESDVRQGALEPPASELSLTATDPDGTTLFVVEHLDDNWPDGIECRPALCARALRTRDPEPVVLFDAALDYAREQPPHNPVAFGDHLHPAVVMLPIGAPAALSDAGYVLALDLEHPGDARVTRLWGPAGGQRLDLNLFYVGALDFEPEGDRGPGLLADALAIVDEIFAQADIYIGEVRQITVPGELPMYGTAFLPEGHESQGFAVLEIAFWVYVELPALFRLSAGAGNSAINLFFVSEIEPRVPGAEPEAESGGIPGPLGMHGTGASGIAISTDMMAGNAEMLGRTLAHEIAHYLGLFHTSEADGRVFDPLDDTPACRLEHDLDANGRLSVSECQDAGVDNLMFWAKTTGTALTEQQRGVLRRALILQ